MTATTSIKTSLTFLSRSPTYTHEKPYRLRYDPGPDLSRTNCINESQSNIQIQDIRGHEQDYTIDKNGFEVLKLESKLRPEQFYDKKTVRAVWCEELKECLKEKFGAKRVEVLEFGIRKRHEDFPISTGEDYEFLQPTSIIHIDFTPEAALATSEQALGVKRDSWSRLQTLNIWKPLYGPLTDWPLSVCDSRTISPSRDCIATDVVEREGYTENYQVYYHPDMRFYYLGGQRVDEIIAFRQTDTKGGCEAGVPHAGFHNPKTVIGERPRESIETRVFIYW